MGLGILEDRHLAHVPGTAILEDDIQGDEVPVLDPNLKYDTTGPRPIVLVPQPSDDPNDPRTDMVALWFIRTGHYGAGI
ncbi:hypothetical protein TWF718_010284 [Orbilia javanica]|uniref:Uncharacterized protein n=1 Tax=Orbilia javanica TaxID=47235 RepID=A0AAN8NPD8_9PEZI